MSSYEKEDKDYFVQERRVEQYLFSRILFVGHGQIIAVAMYAEALAELDVSLE